MVGALLWTRAEDGGVKLVRVGIYWLILSTRRVRRCNQRADSAERFQRGCERCERPDKPSPLKSCCASEQVLSLYTCETINYC